MAINPATNLEDPDYTPPPATPPVTPPIGGALDQSVKDLSDQAVVYNKPTTAPEITARDITAKETVSGQLNDLLSQDSKYMQSAKANAMEKANSRGLINSSMAVGAGQKAAIDSALPIATSDANINANAGQEAQQAGHQVQLTGYQGDINAALQTQQSAEQRKNAATQGLIQSSINTQQGTIQRDLNTQNIEANKALQAQNNADAYKLQTELKQMGLELDYAKLDADARNRITESAGTLNQQWIDFQKAIYTNKEMTPEARAQALTEGAKTVKATVNFMLVSNGIKDTSGQPLAWDPGTGLTPAPTTTGGTPPPTTPTAEELAAATAGKPWNQLQRGETPTQSQIDSATSAGYAYDPNIGFYVPAAPYEPPQQWTGG